MSTDPRIPIAAWDDRLVRQALNRLEETFPDKRALRGGTSGNTSGVRRKGGVLRHVEALHATHW